MKAVTPPDAKLIRRAESNARALAEPAVEHEGLSEKGKQEK